MLLVICQTQLMIQQLQRQWCQNRSIIDFKKDLEEGESNLTLKLDYAFDMNYDYDYTINGIPIAYSNIVIEGNKPTLNMNGLGFLFNVINSNMNISNLNIKNTRATAILLKVPI